MTAEEIAASISLVVDKSLQNVITGEECSMLTKTLWDMAKSLNLTIEVAQILHKDSMAEINKLMAGTLRRFKYTFMDRLRSGEVKDPEEAAEDSVKHWHESDEPCSLQEWLGMDTAEYEQFVLDPLTLYNQVISKLKES